jgi:hypothetical protein
VTDTHLTAPTRFIEVDGARFAYRRWGNASSGQPPIFLLQDAASRLHQARLVAASKTWPMTLPP